jgi:serine protease Do
MRRHSSTWKVAAWSAAVASVLVVGGMLATGIPGDATADDTPSRVSSSEAVGSARQLSQAFRDAAEQVLPAVVAIRVTPQVAMRERTLHPSADQPGIKREFRFFGTPDELLKQHPELKRFFEDMPGGFPKGFPQMPDMPRRPGLGVPSPQPRGLGSGVIFDSDGLVLTNNHVVANGGKVMVKLHDGREFEAKKVFTDPKSDLAVVRIDGENLPVASLGDSDRAQVGDWVLALGEPFGLEGTVTAGIVSAKSRGIGITEREDFIQTDAAINPGNSGGPLINLDGEVVGINTAISSRTGGYQGIGFAVPVNLAKWVANQLVSEGKVRRAYLGVAIQPVTYQLSEHLGVPVQGGVLVTDVMAETPAAKAGLKSGDVIVEFAGKPVRKTLQLQGVVERAKIGQAYPLVVVRDGARKRLSITLLEQPSNFGRIADGVVKPDEGEKTEPERSELGRLGMTVEPLTAEVAGHLGLEGQQGLVITEVTPGGPAAEVGLSDGMLITHVNRKPVQSVQEMEKMVDAATPEAGVLLRVRTERGARFVVVKPNK